MQIRIGYVYPLKTVIMFGLNLIKFNSMQFLHRVTTNVSGHCTKTINLRKPADWNESSLHHSLFRLLKFDVCFRQTWKFVIKLLYFVSQLLNLNSSIELIQSKMSSSKGPLSCVLQRFFCSNTFEWLWFTGFCRTWRSDSDPSQKIGPSVSSIANEPVFWTLTLLKV